MRCRPARGQGGFTYVGALLFVTLLGAALALAAELWSTQSQREREEELLFAGRQIRSAIESYYENVPAGQQRRFPARLEELLDDRRWPGLRRHLRRLYIDPMTGSPDWILVAAPGGGGIIGVRSRALVRPFKRTGFELDEDAFENAPTVGEWAFVYASDGRRSKGF